MDSLGACVKDTERSLKPEAAGSKPPGWKLCQGDLWQKLVRIMSQAFKNKTLVTWEPRWPMIPEAKGLALETTKLSTHQKAQRIAREEG